MSSLSSALQVEPSSGSSKTSGSVSNPHFQNFIRQQKQKWKLNRETDKLQQNLGQIEASTQIQKNKETTKKLSQLYLNQIEVLNQTLQTARFQYLRHKITQQQKYLQRQTNSEQSLQISQRLQKQRLLNQALKCYVQSINVYLQTLGSRLLVQDHLNYQKEIQGYIDRQGRVFTLNKHKINTIVKERQQILEGIYHQINQTNKNKERQIQGLSAIKQQLIKNIHAQKIVIEQQKEREEDRYKKIADLTLKLVEENKSNQESEVLDDVKNNKTNDSVTQSPKQEVQGSDVYSSGPAQLRPQTALLQSAVQISCTQKTCQIQSNLRKQLKQRRYPILILLILSLLLWLL